VRRFLRFAVFGGVAGIAVGLALIAMRGATTPTRPGVLLTVGPSAKANPYAVAQGSVTHGEAVLLDFGDQDLVFFVNRPEEIRALINGCGERVTPLVERRFPVLVEARFRLRNVPPYRIETPSVHYRFSTPPTTSDPPHCD
jgi:hypothetical protein